MHWCSKIKWTLFGVPRASFGVVKWSLFGVRKWAVSRFCCFNNPFYGPKYVVASSTSTMFNMNWGMDYPYHWIPRKSSIDNVIYIYIPIYLCYIPIHVTYISIYIYIYIFPQYSITYHISHIFPWYPYDFHTFSPGMTPSISSFPSHQFYQGWAAVRSWPWKWS